MEGIEEDPLNGLAPETPAPPGDVGRQISLGLVAGRHASAGRCLDKGESRLSAANADGFAPKPNAGEGVQRDLMKACLR